LKIGTLIDLIRALNTNITAIFRAPGTHHSVCTVTRVRNKFPKWLTNL